MIDLQIASPNPIPFDLVVKKGSKIRSTLSGSIPVPESSISSKTRESSSPDSILDFGDGVDRIHVCIQKYLQKLAFVAAHRLRIRG
jgi:hypothetical protein